MKALSFAVACSCLQFALRRVIGYPGGWKSWWVLIACTCAQNAMLFLRTVTFTQQNCGKWPWCTRSTFAHFQGGFLLYTCQQLSNWLTGWNEYSSIFQEMPTCGIFYWILCILGCIDQNRRQYAWILFLLVDWYTYYLNLTHSWFIYARNWEEWVDCWL